jgi:CheY-like chemotaxis protein
MAHIFVVDDNRDSTDMLVLLLQMRMPGLRVQAFYRASDALAALRQDRPVAIVSDLQMPGMDGHAFARAVADACPGGAMPLMVAVSGNSEEVTQAMEEPLYACSFLKPVPSEALVALLRQHASAA